MTEQTMRCFIGVPVDHQVALALLDVRDQALAALGQAQVRPVLARNFHLTLAFLGHQPASPPASVTPWLTGSTGWCPGIPPSSSP